MFSLASLSHISMCQIDVCVGIEICTFLSFYKFFFSRFRISLVLLVFFLFSYKDMVNYS